MRTVYISYLSECFLNRCLIHFVNFQNFNSNVTSLGKILQKLLFLNNRILFLEFKYELTDETSYAIKTQLCFETIILLDQTSIFNCSMNYWLNSRNI